MKRKVFEKLCWTMSMELVNVNFYETANVQPYDFNRKQRIYSSQQIKSAVFFICNLYNMSVQPCPSSYKVKVGNVFFKINKNYHLVITNMIFMHFCLLNLLLTTIKISSFFHLQFTYHKSVQPCPSSYKVKVGNVFLN